MITEEMYSRIENYAKIHLNTYEKDRFDNEFCSFIELLEKLDNLN